MGQKCIPSKRTLTSLTSIIKTKVFYQVHFLKQIGKFTFRFQVKISFSFSSMLLAAAAKSLQSCPTLCDPIDGSPPGSPVPGILQARTLEWSAISFSNA